jgi:hypothetical protein
MSKELFYVLQISSTLSAAFPLIIGFLNFTKIDLRARLFLTFLAIGFLTDLSGWYFYLTKNSTANIFVRDGYNLIEPVFLFWVVSQFSPLRLVKSIFAKAWIVIIPFWCISIFYDSIFALFKTTTEVLLAFSSSFCLLAQVEKSDKVTRQLSFWILLGIFFYNFCTFFFMSLMSSKMGFDLWYLHNIINVVTNLIYFGGFWITYRSATLVPVH